MNEYVAIQDIEPVLQGRRLIPTVTLWNRLEGRPRRHDFDRALKAEVRDALWMLTKQWQMGELTGDDAGSAVLAQVHLDTTRLTKYRPGTGPAEPFDDDVPLEAIRGDVENTGNPALGLRIMVPCERTIPEPARFSLLHQGRGTMLDHLLVSRSLLGLYRTSEIHNEVLHDESAAFADDRKFPESDDAPVVAEFALPA